MPNNELATVSRPRASSSEIARQWLVKFAEVCQKDFSSALAAIWAEQLRDIEPDLLERSCDRLMKKWTSGFLPVPGNIREIAEQELSAANVERLFQEGRAIQESQKRAALTEHHRALAWAEHKNQQKLLAPSEPKVDMTQAMPIRDIPRVIDFEGRQAEMQRQKKLILEKYRTA